MSALITEYGPLYKVLNEDGTACISPTHDLWPMPANDQPGVWMKVTGKLIPCKHGLHLCRRQDLMEWLGPVMFEAEARGRVVVVEDKIVVSEARLLRKLETWNECTARLFAADCAEHILDAMEGRYSSDLRSRKAIEIARLFANGQATEQELAAAWAAARDAADAARYAARSAAWSAAGAARYAAGYAADAAWSAADAAWSAAGAAAGYAERQWQTDRLWWYLDGEAA